MTDLVERLRSNLYPHSIDHEAAAEIKRLRADNLLWQDRCLQFQTERDALRAEVEALSQALQAANDGALRERAEVEWLRAREREAEKLLTIAAPALSLSGTEMLRWRDKQTQWLEEGGK